jgi:hypothetical protein
MTHRLGWFRDVMKEFGGDHRRITLGKQAECLCGFQGEDEEQFLTHFADAIVGVLGRYFQVVEFDQSWQVVYGCNEPDCQAKGIDRDLHQHQLGGLRVELREKVARPVPRSRSWPQEQARSRE